MMGGMVCVFSYDMLRDECMDDFLYFELIYEMDMFYIWVILDVVFYMSLINFVLLNICNQFNLSVEVGYNENLEVEFSY